MSLDFPAVLGMMNGAKSMPSFQGYIYHLITWYYLLFILNAVLGMVEKIHSLQMPRATWPWSRAGDHRRKYLEDLGEMSQLI